jgi:hypothetical protein
MSIHVISAVLKCRDPELSSSRRMVMVVLANYAGDTGKAWPSQQLIADETGCGVRSIKDHLAWLEKAGFITRHTQNLGQGNGSRTSYQIHLDRLERTAPDAGEEIAGANIARAKKREPRCNIPHLTNRQEPSIDTIAKAIVAPQPPDPPESKSTGRVRGAARGNRIAPNWAPTITDYAFASSEGMTREDINREADKFRDYWSAKSGREACKLDWSATWRNWVRSDFRKRNGSGAGNASRNGSRTEAFDRLAERLQGSSDRADAWQHDEPATEGGYVIDASPTRITG